MFLGKPINRWGWARIVSFGVLAGVLAWTIFAAFLRYLGDVPWMRWSGYQAFSLTNGVQLAVLPLLAALISEWLEEHDNRVAAEQSDHREAENAAAARRGKILEPLYDAVLAAVADREPVSSEQVSGHIGEIVRAALAELDGVGRGELLRFLFQKGLLNGERPLVALDGADFRAVTVQNAQLSGIYLAWADLRKARLDGAHLAKSHFDGANLRKAFLRRADLREAHLPGCDLSGARLEHANLEGADLRGARLENVLLKNADLKNCMLSSPEALDQAILIETTFPDGRKVTNEKGKEYLRNKEIAILVDRL